MANGFGDAIRARRDARGWSQDVLAKKAGVSRELVSRAENGGNIGVLYLYRMASALNVEIGEFFGVSTKKPEQPPSWFSRLKGEQRDDVLRYARRLLGEREP